MILAQRTANLNTELIHQYLCSCQQKDGAIPWFENGKLDPWDHTEAAMAFSILGDQQRALLAFNWLKDNQNRDGSWQANYYTPNCETPNNIETNFVAYPATGIWHHYLIFRDINVLKHYFPMVERAIEFVLALQHREGDILWAVSSHEQLPKDALVTACSSILRSLECAIKIAIELGLEKTNWQIAYKKLADALLNKPWRFDRTWESKARYSMDWFYPILAGIFSQEEASLRLEKRWHEFVEESLGCRCVNDEPWVTVAESCELIIACLAAGQENSAKELFKYLAQWQDEDGGYWTGYSFRDKVIWPKEKTSWTAAAVILAADALYQFSPAARLFTTSSAFLGD
ncbi:hypothetical protein SAMN02745866_01428 [Alteromonadaceae bacterium Bs31]|nr:hypothetical protein SAMN02745866_01428 [Alteromonadaceae bacterium Bs31]